MTAKSRKAQLAGLSEFTRTRKEASRRRLLEAARRVFNRYGYLAPSVDDIAQEAGVSRQTFYRHFDGKLAIAMEYFDRQKCPPAARCRPKMAEYRCTPAIRLNRTWC
jgi:AcrR family transcriptional regulator